MKRFTRCWSMTIIGFMVLTALVMPGSIAQAKGGSNVLPPTSMPKGYSLFKAAAATAAFNLCITTPDCEEPTSPPADFPFQFLYIPAGQATNTFNVKPGTMFYVPVVYDNAPADFVDVTNQAAVRNYFFSPELIGAEYIRITVDGEIYGLGPEYVVGVQTTEPLVTGRHDYAVAAAFLTPLPTGIHTVIIESRFSGKLLGGAVFEGHGSYTVIVG
jgi:hypothetical protein